MNWIRKTKITPEQIRTEERNGVTFLTFPAFEGLDWLRHGFSTRLGGVSEGKLGSMNLGYLREKDPETVRENFRRIGAAIGFDPENLVLSKQTHTVNIRVVHREDRGSGYSRERGYDNIDGLITDEPDVVLATFYADCVPLLIADPAHRAIGSAHSGWRGTVHDMGGEVIRAMNRQYGTDPKDVICVIGPSICQDCYEVSRDVIEEFEARYPKEVHPQLWRDGRQGKYQLNLWEACRQNFLKAGVPADRIHLPDLCTCCNPELLFSHRASGGVHGNLAAFMQIR